MVHAVWSVCVLTLQHLTPGLQTPSELTLEHYGFTEADLKKQVTVPPLAIFDTVRHLSCLSFVSCLSY
jgi:2-oxoglutarate dehydrogenase complex dehydrogenase (E1) component-like enzyme